jgi:hypothetical protein
VHKPVRQELTRHFFNCSIAIQETRDLHREVYGDTQTAGG